MPNGKLIALCVVGGLAVVGIILAIVIRSRGAAPDTPGQRLLAHSRDRDDYRMFVGVPPADPTAWAEVTRVSESSITLHDFPDVKLSEVTAYLIAYPSGALVDHRSPKNLPLPPWVGGLKTAGVPEYDELTEADLKEGQRLVHVTFGRSTGHPDSRGYYATTLTNISDRRVRVLRFGGYWKSGNGFVLSNVSKRFYTAAEFKEWYGQAGDWIAPGLSVTDPNNYGNPPVL